MIEIKGIEVKTKVSEMTLKEYEHFIFTVNDADLTREEMYLKLLAMCGMNDDDILMTVTSNDIDIFIDELNKDIPDYENLEFQKTIQLGNKKYIAFEGEDFEISYMDFAKIKKAIKGDKKWLLRAMAILFKDEKLGYKEHYTEAHLKYKESLFAKENASICIPYITNILSSISNNIKEEEDSNKADAINDVVEGAKDIK